MQTRTSREIERDVQFISSFPIILDERDSSDNGTLEEYLRDIGTIEEDQHWSLWEDSLARGRSTTI